MFLLTFTQELSPLNLSEELQKQDTDDDQYGKTLIGSGKLCMVVLIGLPEKIVLEVKLK